ncbi:MAG: YgiQ family radical SAM protein [Desulfobacteraceae bacterium]|nr:MAG: YgiQ family radical SAM protein [Desulfobacteraceae bacterium]
MSQTPAPPFLPTTRRESDQLGWTSLDVILVTGDTYIDAPHIGVAVIGRVLLAAGFRVGIIAQPDVDSARDITRLGEPELFWGVTAGCIDSMIANFTASGKRRKSDDMTTGGINNRRPDRAVLVYSHLIRRHYKQTRPIVLGGIEASLRRISHYDAWSDTVRRSILFDAKADLLLYGMADQTVVTLARMLRQKEDVGSLRGLCYIRREPPPPEPEWAGPDLLLPAHDAVAADPQAFAAMYRQFYAHADPPTARRLLQRQDTRYLVHNPPALPPRTDEIDAVYELPFSREVHPYYRSGGQVAALQTIQFSLTTHRGCFGECRFCAISVHQGRQVVSRSQASLLREARAMRNHPDFKGIIADVGGPTANMYAMGCRRPHAQGMCAKKSCLFPKTCRQLSVDHQPQITLLRAIRAIAGIRKVFVASGVRYDLILADPASGTAYLEELLRRHVSGQLKIAPEHVHDSLLHLMGKPDHRRLETFRRLFDALNRRMPRPCYLTYYFMAAHPGCSMEEMRALRVYAETRLRLIPEQVQIFTPSPATYSTLMYHTGIDPFTGRALFVEKSARSKTAQKSILTELKNRLRKEEK